MISQLTRIILLLDAYLPLVWIIYFNLFFSYSTWIYIIIPTVYSFIILIYTKSFINSANKLSANSHHIDIQENRTSEILSFLVTYIFPFIPISVPTNSIFSFIIIFIIVGYFYLTTDLFAINPILRAVFKFNLYLGTENYTRIFILTKRILPINHQEIQIVKLVSNIYLEKERDDVIDDTTEIEENP